MKAALRRAFVLGAAFVLLGCAGPQIFHGQLTKLDKGITKAEARSRLNLQPLSTHSATVGNREFEFDAYNMNNGVQIDGYLLGYEKERLLYWGYPHEFRRQSDKQLDEALTMVLRQLNNKRSITP